jgi:hypothetical protein
MNLPKPPLWYKSDGTPQDAGESLAAGTYYCEIPKGRASAFSLSLIAGAAMEATATLEGNDCSPTLVTGATTSGAAGGASGWVSYAIELGTKTITATVGGSVVTWQVPSFESARARVKLVVTVADTCMPVPTIGTN